MMDLAAKHIWNKSWHYVQLHLQLLNYNHKGWWVAGWIKQAGAELGKAQPKLGLGKIKINLALRKSRKVV